jgi:hypothetical protein
LNHGVDARSTIVTTGTALGWRGAGWTICQILPSWYDRSGSSGQCAAGAEETKKRSKRDAGSSDVAYGISLCAGEGTIRMHDEEAYIRLQDRSLELIEAQLSADLDELTIDELLAVDDFLQQIGGQENARLAIALLKTLETTA